MPASVAESARAPLASPNASLASCNAILASEEGSLTGRIRQTPMQPFWQGFWSAGKAWLLVGIVAALLVLVFMRPG